MGASNSTLNISEMAMSAKLTQSNRVESNINCRVSQDNTISLSQLGCGSATANVGGINQGNDAFCRVEQNMNTINNQKAKQDLQQTLQQAAESTMKGINVGTTNSAENRSRTSVRGEVELDNVTAQNCNADIFQLNQLYLTQSGIQGACDANFNDITQNNKANASAKCGLKSKNTQDAEQRISQSVSQVASATMVGIDPRMIYLIHAILGLAGTALFVWATKSMFAKLLLLVIIGLLIFNIYQLSGTKNPLDSEIPWPYTYFTDDTHYYEEMKQTGQDKNLFIVKYSKVFPLTTEETASSDLKNIMMKKGLMNEEYKNIHGYNNSGNINKGEEDTNFTASSSGATGGISKYGGKWPQPEDASDFMYLPDNIKKYYAFEIIKYGIDEEGNIVVLDEPITLFYTELNEIFWNYDLLKETKCIDDKICGIDESNFLKVGGLPARGGKQCTTDEDCGDDDYFCGTGGVGCIKCDYCKKADDGYGGSKKGGKYCMETCGTSTPTRISLRDELDKCKICLGNILQQTEILESGKIKYKDVRDIRHSSTYPNYISYIQDSEFNSELSNDYSDNIPSVYGTIRLKTSANGDKKIKRYEGKNRNNEDLWIDVDVGFSEAEFPSSINLKDNIDLVNDFIQMKDSYITSNSLNPTEKCIYTPIEYEPKPSDTDSSGCSLDYTNPKPLDKSKAQELTVSGSGWSSATDITYPDGCESEADTTDTCYNIGNSKCVDQYEATCGILSGRASEVYKNNNPRSTFSPCDTDKKLNNIKTLKGADEGVCGEAAYNGSLPDGVNDILQLWNDQCKSLCCVDADSVGTELSTIFNQGHQGHCKYVPSGSIGEFKRILPHETNVIGIRMYRDGSNMNESPDKRIIDKLNNAKIGSYILLVVFIILLIKSLFKSD